MWIDAVLVVRIEAETSKSIPPLGLWMLSLTPIGTTHDPSRDHGKSKE
jgi:hypothetical protein